MSGHFEGRLVHTRHMVIAVVAHCSYTRSRGMGIDTAIEDWAYPAGGIDLVVEVCAIHTRIVVGEPQSPKRDLE